MKSDQKDDQVYFDCRLCSKTNDGMVMGTIFLRNVVQSAACGRKLKDAARVSNTRQLEAAVCAATRSAWRMITATERKCVKAELGGAGVGGGVEAWSYVLHR